MPTRIAAVMPCLVVRFQKSSMTSAGRLAEAAMLNAQPTRKVTFICSKSTPSTMAMAPTTTATPLAGADLAVIVEVELHHVGQQVVRDRAAGRDDQAADRARARW